MALDPVKNFAKVVVSTGYAAGATSIVLQSGHGAKLPLPSTDGDFNLVWWNATSFGDPSDDPNVEIVRCTARSTDTLTVTRGQESTSDTNKNTAGGTYKMILAPTKKMIDDIETEIAGGLPTGTILAYGGSSAPSGYLLCDGASVSQSTYAALYAVIGTTYGDPGGGNFNLPDMRGKVPVGKDTGTFSTQGGTGGAETHTLSTAEMPSHTHLSGWRPDDESTGFNSVQETGLTSQAQRPTGSAGSSNAHNNLQPYQVHQFIIKT